MASQAVGFAEVIAGGILLTAGIGGHSIREVLKGKGGSIKPLPQPKSGAGPATVNASPGAAAAGGTTNPLPGWSRSRVDQGVDFYGGRRIVAPESGTITKIGAPGWPEGGGVLLHTVSGKFIYFYEGLDAAVGAGTRVAAGQLIARGREGGSIEVGYADSNGVPLAHGEYSEDGIVTRWGKKFAQWLDLIGAPR
jgi:murein DD-endopeptidase MepM/ murein hydrolase activator NlpD